VVSGLCVAVTFDGRSVTGDDVSAMAAAASHRGAPADVWEGPGAAMVRQRVPAKHPASGMATSGGLVVVVDSRIDNRQELRSTLTHHGLIVDAHEPDDAELFLAAFRLWGETCPQRVIGDFAVVVWDRYRRRLLAARDPMGMRPLYLHHRASRRVLLASEVKQLLAAPDVPCRIYEPAIATTLAGPFTPPSWTVYEQIAQVEPGHAVVVDEGGIRRFPFWSPDPAHVLRGIDESEAAERFRSTFARAVEARVRPGRTVGILLSGGMDSGSIASMAGALRERSTGPGHGAPKALRTYSWAFDELPDSDERGVSRHVVRRYDLVGTDVPADDWWPLARYPAYGPDRDDPYSWVYQALIEHTLTRCRADGVDTQLVGDRGDELCGDWVYDELGMVRAGRVADALDDLHTEMRATGLSPTGVLRRRVARPVIATRWPDLARRLSRRRPARRWPPWVPDALARRVDLDDIIGHMTAPPDFGDAARRQRHARIFMAQGARIAVLRNRSRARHGMEFADPYADRHVIELVLALPQWLVQRRGQPKQILRSAMDGIMPKDALRSARKTIPHGLFDRGFRDRAVATVDDLLTAPCAAAHGWLDADAARTVYDRYRQGHDVAWDFWWPLTVEMWLRAWWTDGPSR